MMIAPPLVEEISLIVARGGEHGIRELHRRSEITAALPARIADADAPRLPLRIHAARENRAAAQIGKGIHGAACSPAACDAVECQPLDECAAVDLHPRTQEPHLRMLSIISGTFSQLKCMPINARLRRRNLLRRRRMLRGTRRIP